MQQLVFAIGTMIAGVLACAFYFFATNWLLDRIFPSKGLSGAKASRNLRTTNAIRPWLFMLPALVALAASMAVTARAAARVVTAVRAATVDLAAIAAAAARVAAAKRAADATLAAAVS